MEDYFTHQPNLILILTGTSDKLSTTEKTWFYKNWTNPIPQKNRVAVTKQVIALVRKTNAINGAKGVLKKIREKLKKSLESLPDEDFRKYITAWAFRSFPLDR